MSRKTWIKLKRGLLDPKHRDRIGIRIWLYLYILDRANWDEGAVLTWRDRDVADDLEMPIDTVRQQRRQLEAAGYLQSEHKRDHLRLLVCKWVNPREYSGQVYNPPGLAVPEDSQSLQSSPLWSDEGDNQSGNQGDNQSGYQSGELSPPLIGITRHTSQTTDQVVGLPRPTNSDGFVICPRCGILVNPLTLEMSCEGTHFTRVHAKVQR